jgi:hypothetical protein
VPLDIYIDPNAVASLVPSATVEEINSAIGITIALMTSIYSSTSPGFSLLTAIGTYLSAHYVVASSNGGAAGIVKSEKVLDAQITYAVSDDLSITSNNFETTSFGKIAISLDTTGLLKNTGSKRAFFEAI